MKIRQWEVWKTRPPGFERDHWFVIISGQERLDSARHTQVNGLACFTLRGSPLKTDVLSDFQTVPHFLFRFESWRATASRASGAATLTNAQRDPAFFVKNRRRSLSQFSGYCQQKRLLLSPLTIRLGIRYAR